jgi:hypothetical protein
MDLRYNVAKDIYGSQQVSVYRSNISLNGPAAKSRGSIASAVLHTIPVLHKFSYSDACGI